MPRQDVPYGGAICRLRERIAEIFDKLGEKLHTINGVPGDGDGNVKIVSGSSAVVINNDPTQNEISVALDSSQLPAAAVSSVNGQTGAVALDAGDIPTVGGDVQADLQDLANDISGNTAAINAEVLARQGADSTLQTNINTVTASLPSAAAAAVAADPTVAYVASEINNKVDKITSGSSLKAYTHTGATQGETSIVDGTTANTIGIRDANGRMQAADPASGATDKTLVTANWVSQSGDSAPNNLMHRNGNETIYDIKSYDSAIKGRICGDHVGNVGGILANDHTSVVEMLSIKLPYLYGVEFTISGGANNQNFLKADYVLLRSRSGTNPALYCLSKKATGSSQMPKLYFSFTNTDEFTIYGLKTQYTYQFCDVTNYLYYGERLIKPQYRMTPSPNSGTIVTLPADAVEEIVL